MKRAGGTVIILFRQRKLAQNLREDAVTEKQQIWYLIIYNLLAVLTVFLARKHWEPEGHFNLFYRLNDLIVIVYSIALIFYLFSLNKRGDGRNFFVRYICLSVPISVKMFLLSFPIGATALVLDNPKIASVAKNSSEFHELVHHAVMGPYSCTATVILLLFSFWLYRGAFKLASGQSSGGGSILSIFGSDEGAGAV